jgi:hypothetical protein
MFKSRAERIVNLLSAVLVLVAGFYIIVFMASGLSAMVRIIIGVLLGFYFIWRINYYLRSPERREKLTESEQLTDNKRLDK